MTSNPYSAFTTTCSGIAPKLMTKAWVQYAGNSNEVDALWDTGATTTCISQELAKRLNMVPTGKSSILTPSGGTIVNTYLIDIALPNGVTVKDVVVCDSNIGAQKIDLLIGMNIINCGEFCVSSYGGKTTFSFIVPPISEANFLPKAKTYNSSMQGHKRKKK